MIPHFPYSGIPYYNRYSRYGYRYPYYTYPNCSKKNYDNRNNNPYNKDKINSNHSTCENNNIKNEKNNSTKNCSNENLSPIFNLFGINLYFDDILIICLIWFLYNEDVKDEELFVSLILLLLS